MVGEELRMHDHVTVEQHHVFAARQRDRFDFWRWARQALGAPGWLLGWSPLLRNKVRATAAKNLARFMASRQP